MPGSLSFNDGKLITEPAIHSMIGKHTLKDSPA
jgi:hypothetical protein